MHNFWFKINRTHLYPDLMACLTAAATSPGLDFHVPRPTTGIECPEESFTVDISLAATEVDGGKYQQYF